MKKMLALILAALTVFALAVPFALADEGGTDSSPAPTETPAETAAPTATPTAAPTAAPTATPTPAATQAPTEAPAVTATPYLGSYDECVTMGADLTKAQRKAVYQDFGIEEGSVPELTVTNAEERAYLEDLVPDRKIGSVAISCIYIKKLEAGTGLTIEVRNINYCTEDMYLNALTTAGIEDASVIVTAPFPVSGTGALTGVYKAYEKMTGNSLSDLAKAVGAEELVVTGELAEYIGSAEAAELIKELKGMLDKTKDMTDADVRAEIDSLAKTYNVSLTDAQRDQILSLVRKLEGLSTEELQSRLTSLAKTAQTASNAAQTVSRVYENVKSFFAAVGNFFSTIFTKKS